MRSVKAHPHDSPSRIANQFKGFTSRMLRQDFHHKTARALVGSCDAIALESSARRE
ncbi:MAG TPA: hypothetical protein VE733_21615 [Streptosporangiaceae bacterium]|jgi:REP element-mobilizing transposase RayT|nr:hypothetical protein [Streptosporangiaceae bacterium]